MGRPSNRGLAAVDQWLDSDGQTELARLTQALRDGQGQASLIVVRCNEPGLRAYLHSELARRLDGLQIQEVEVYPTQPDLPRWLIEVVQPETDVVFVSNLEMAIPAVLTYLNYRRETLLWLNRPVVMWANEWAVQEMIRHAPDFWAFRRHLFEFIPARAALERLAVQMLEGTDWVYANVDELADRIALHRALIADMEAKGIGKSALTAGLQRDLGVLQQRTGQWSEAKATLAEALAIFRDLGDRAGVAKSLHEIGRVHQARGDYPAALEHYRRSLEIKEQLGDRVGVASSQHEIGRVHQARGDYPAALEHYRRSLEIAEQLGDRAGVAQSLHQIGMVHQACGDYPAALEHYRRSLEIAEQLGDRAGVAQSLGQIGQVAQLQGDYVMAVRLWAQALATFEALGMPERNIVVEWFSRLQEELGAERFEAVLREAGLEYDNERDQEISNQ